MAGKSRFSYVVLLPLLILNIVGQRKVEGVEWIHGALNNVETVKNIKHLLDEFHDIPIHNSSKVNKLLDYIKKLDLQINKLNDLYINSRKVSLEELSKFFPTELKNLDMEVKEIEYRYDYMMLTISENLENFGDFAMKEFANRNMKPSYHAISEKIFSIFSNYIGYKNNSSQALVYKIVSKFQEEASPPISIQQLLYSDYLELTILGIKEYLITKFSWAVLAVSEGTNFRTEENNFISEYEKRISFLSNKLGKLMRENRGELRKGDPNKWEENINYDQLTRLVQGYIANEATLSPTGSCSGECSNYANTYTHTCPFDCCEKDKIEGTGKIVSCESSSSDTFYEVCPSEKPERRYNHVTVKDTYTFTSMINTYGKKHPCPTKQIRARSCSRGFYMCSFCFCLIDDKSEKSDRFFSLREVLSDFDQNKVVTGVRFVKKNRIMHLQIQQGILGPLGQIKVNTTQWKDVEEFELKERINGVDFITFDSDRKSIDLDDVEDENPHTVVTGVKLSTLGSHLHLEVRKSVYVFETGKMFNPKTASFWISNTSDNSVKLPLKGLLPNRGPNVSTRAPCKSSPSPAIYNYLEFTHSDKIDDASQTTLPFIDIQGVAFQDPSPLSGVGLYHKGLKGYGGFLAPKIFGINFSSHV